MEKLKKIAKAWGIIALFMLVSSFVVEDLSRSFYGVFIAIFAVSALFVLFGWDKYITYGDDGPAYSKPRPFEEDADDWLDN